jgi:hypothetical protein
MLKLAEKTEKPRKVRKQKSKHILDIVIMSLLFEYTNVTNEIHGHVFFVTSSFDCSCRSSHLLGRSEGRKGNDVQSLKDSLFPAFVIENIALCFYCYTLLFLGLEISILKNHRED